MTRWIEACVGAGGQELMFPARLAAMEQKTPPRVGGAADRLVNGEVLLGSADKTSVTGLG